MTNFIKYKDSQYGEGIEVDEYNGTISLVSSREGDNGKVYKQWCYPQRGTFEERKPHTKSVPWKIAIGNDKESAILMLGKLANIVKSLGDDSEENPFG